MDHTITKTYRVYAETTLELSPSQQSQGKPLRWPWMWLSLYNQNSCPDSLDEWNNLTWEYFNILHDNIHNIHLQIKYFNISHQIHLEIESREKPELPTNYHIAAYCELRTTSFGKFFADFPLWFVICTGENDKEILQ